MACLRVRMTGIYGDGFVCVGSQHEPGETECREMIWSAGRACKKCKVKCYRADWSESEVRADNAKLVRENNTARRLSEGIGWHD